MANLTPEELAQVTDYVQKANAFASGEHRHCPQCDAPVEGVTLYAKSEPEMFSLYVRPCDHRLGLWSAAPKWIAEAGLPITVVPFSADEMEEYFAQGDESESTSYEPSLYTDYWLTKRYGDDRPSTLRDYWMGKRGCDDHS